MVKRRRDALLWGCCLLFAAVNVALLLMPRPQLPPDMIETDKRESPAERAAAIQEQLDGVLKYDEEIAAKWDLPADEVARAPSVKLLTHFSASPMRVWLGLYEQPEIGALRAIRGSKSLAALVQRPDMIEAFIEWNKQYIEQINQLQSDSTNGGELSSQIVACDDLLRSGEILQKTKGYERELLKVLCERYRAMTETNALFDADNKPFGASFNSLVHLIKSMADVVDPTANWNHGDEAELVARAESLVK